MTLEERFINPIERSLLSDLVGLYTCDLSTEVHLPLHGQCLACSKEAIVEAILAYQSLDALIRAEQEQEKPEQDQAELDHSPPRPP